VIPNGPIVVVMGPSLRADDVDGDWRVDLLIASPRNREIVAIAKKLVPGVVVFDEAFVCQSHPGTRRVTVRDLHALQRELLPLPSVVLAPGESWSVTAKDKR
jgi:hypothetical protein